MVSKKDLFRHIEGLEARIKVLEAKVSAYSEDLVEVDRKAVLNEKKMRTRMSAIEKKVENVASKLDKAIDVDGELPKGVEQAMTERLNEWMYGKGANVL